MNQSATEHVELDASRRQLLARAGRFAYAAPMVVLLTEPRNAAGAYRPDGVPPPRPISPPRPRG